MICKTCKKPITDELSATVAGKIDHPVNEAKIGTYHLRCLEEEVENDWVDAIDWHRNPCNKEK